MAKDCSEFTVKVKDVAKAVANVKNGIKSLGGTFSGDETGGSFKVSTKLGDISGTYTVSGTSVKVKNKVGWALSCDMVTQKIQDYFNK